MRGGLRRRRVPLAAAAASAAAEANAAAAAKAVVAARAAAVAERSTFAGQVVADVRKEAKLKADALAQFTAKTAEQGVVDPFKDDLMKAVMDLSTIHEDDLSAADAGAADALKQDA